MSFSAYPIHRPLSPLLLNPKPRTLNPALPYTIHPGPSGPNYQYLFRLADAMREIAPESVMEDRHLFELEAGVRDVLNAITHA